MIHVRELGEGPPIVLVHGLAGSGGYWGPLAERLAPHRRVLAPDLPGHGRSGRLEPFSIDAAAAALREAVAARGAERPAVVGHSLGSAVALAWAAQEPVPALALVSPVGTTRLRVERARWALPLGRLLAGPLARVSASWTPARRLVFGWFVGMARLDPLDRPTARLLLADAARSAASVPGLLPALAALDVRPLLAPHAAALVVWGSADRLGGANGPVVAEALGARAVELPGVGHMPMLEDPDALAALLLELLEGVP